MLYGQYITTIFPMSTWWSYNFVRCRTQKSCCMMSILLQWEDMDMDVARMMPCKASEQHIVWNHDVVCGNSHEVFQIIYPCSQIMVAKFWTLYKCCHWPTYIKYYFCYLYVVYLTIYSTCGTQFKMSNQCCSPQLLDTIQSFFTMLSKCYIMQHWIFSVEATILHEWLSQMEIVLGHYIDSKSTETWQRLSIYTAQALHKGEALARALWKWTHAFIMDCHALPYGAKNSWIKSLLKKHPELKANVLVCLQSLGKYVHAIDIVHFKSDPVLLDQYGLASPMSLSTAQH